MKERLKKFDFLGHRKIYYIFCIVLIIVSIGVGMIRGYNLGIDFTGGTMIEIEMGEQIDLGRVEDVLSETEIDGAVTYAGEGNTGIIIKTVRERRCSMRLRRRFPSMMRRSPPFQISDLR